jgi:heme/copper-type cytochrome/quinol oxidase subunit 2
MVIPADVNVEIHLDSLDVRHGVYVSQFNFSRHASPGCTTDFNFSSTRERTEASAPSFVGSTTRSSPST